MWGDSGNIIRQFLVSSRAGAPCSDTHGGVFSHSYILKKKKKKRWEKAHGAVPVWLPGHSLARGIWATCSRDVQDSEVQKTTCPWRVTVSFQLLPRHGCAPDMFGGQAMRWGLAVGKYPPCVFLLAVILWLEAEAAGLTDLGSLRLEGIMNTPGRAQGTWEFLKHSSSSFWAP